MNQGKKTRKEIHIIDAAVNWIWRLAGDKIPEKQIEMMSRLYVGKSKTELQKRYLRRQLKALLLVLAGLAVICTLFALQSKGTSEGGDNGIVIRDEVGGNTKSIDLQVKAADDCQEVTVEVPPRTLREEEIREQFAEARSYILETYLGENSSAQSVTKPLVLERNLPDSVIEVDWRLDTAGYVQEDGTLHMQETEEAQQVEIVAQLSYGEEREEIPLTLTLMPEKRSDTEMLWLHWKQALTRCLEETENEVAVQLPKEIDGVSIQYARAKPEKGKWLLGLALLPMLLLPFLSNSRLGQQLQERERELRRDYPEMIEQFVLLVGAGMTIKGAWIRMTEDYHRQQKEGRARQILYEEMSVSVREMESGMSEKQAYELFGRRTGILSYMKFSTLLVQNLRKGSADLLRILEYEALDAFRERKEHAKTLGEEAGTKLLLPMMLMLIIVFAIILYAAFQNM